MRALARLGVAVRYRQLDAASDVDPVGEDLDWAHVVAARGRSSEVLSLLARARACGRPVIDSADAVRAVRDKGSMARALLAAGVPTPATWIAPVADLAEQLPEAAFPVILKPMFGDNARGLRVVDDRRTLRQIRWAESPALAQAYLANDGADTKVYVIGESFTAIRKPSPFTPGPDFAARAVPLTAPLAEVARRCGEIFGLTVFGVDCLLTSDGPLVIEVNDFPNFTGVPGADDALAAHVLAAAHTRSLEGIGS